MPTKTTEELEKVLGNTHVNETSIPTDRLQII